MDIDDVKKHMPDIDEMTKSASQFIKVIVVITVVVVLVVVFSPGIDIANIKHPVQLVQAILVGSTALMGLSGLIIFEIRKANVSDPLPDDMLKKVKALNTMSSLVRANVFLRWSLALSTFTIVFGCLLLVFGSPVLTIITLAAFFDQLYFFVWGLLFSKLLP